ncbi:MAG: HAD-IB family hydrolase [Acidimicrobiales bacterium]|nr:HAD-IB family hydrolase [Actinomycetota bacterium]MDP6280735.1 HAD-IB family hydrolase [Acidimicrobiales bacterium]MDP7117147.1 HAD-IB family hydrolase [Acidimicrobiales bacterium]MDP7410232.1 HAD-IB family hydrolase [Acidimicrobiales bacterium]MDP7598848.1 HAD-IB family hydrolase [Acidimicrobiales bacterium]
MEAAFFDLDKTIIARASMAAYVPALRRAGYLNAPMAARAAWGQVLFRFFGADEDRMDKARRTALKLAAGWEQDGLRRLARDHLTELIEPIVYDEALDLLEHHRSEGRMLVLVSAAPIEIVEPMAAHLQMDRAIATTPLIDAGGYYTGGVEFYAHGPDKAKAMTRLATEEGLDLDGSWAYSDSVTDLPMLESVGHPVVVNPDRELRREAARREWPILEFENPVALGDRIPIDRNWIVATAITFAVFFGVMSMVRRVRRRA